MKKKLFFLLVLSISFSSINAQKILFDATKSEFASNADWVIDADVHNLNSNWPVTTGGNESNPQQIPTPAQSGITGSTSETFWNGGISAWAVDMVKYDANYIIETLPYDGQITYNNGSNSQDLSNYDIFILCEPNSLFTATEKTAIMQFVQNGGGLYIVSDHDIADRNGDGVDAVDVLNDLITNNSVQNNAFGITYNHDNISETPSTNLASLPADDPLLHGPFGDISNLSFHNGASMTINTSDNSTVKAVVYQNSSSNTGTTGVMMAYATFGSGRVVALGDSSPVDDGSGDSNDNLYQGWTDGDNGKLIANGTVWLAGETTPTPSGDCPTDLMISEVVEYGTDKYLEIANFTGSPVSLANYDFVVYYNGNTTIGATIDLDDASTIANGDVFVIADDGSSTSSEVDQIHNNVAFNGNDVIALRKNSSNIDVFGTIGNSANWYDNKIAIRNSTVTSQTTTYNSSEWSISGYSGGVPSSIGSHTLNCGSSTTPELLTSSTSLAGFSYVEGNGPSASQNFELTGSDLDGSTVSVTAPANYEVSLNNTSFSTSINVSYTAPTLNSTTIYVRLKAGLSANTYNGVNLTISGGGASNKTIALSGDVTITLSPALVAGSSSLSGFTYEEGNGPSASQNFELIGDDLDGSTVSVTAPANYEVSLNNTSFSTSVNVSYTAPTLNSTTIYVRLKTGLSANTYNGVNLTISGGGASNETVSLNGNVTTSTTPSCENCPNLILY